MSPRALPKYKMCFGLKVASEASREVVIKTYYVYILRCFDDLLYTGITNDLHRRYRRLKNGAVRKS